MILEANRVGGPAGSQAPRYIIVRAGTLMHQRAGE
jgi:hypothetical protein